MFPKVLNSTQNFPTRDSRVEHVNCHVKVRRRHFAITGNEALKVRQCIKRNRVARQIQLKISSFCPRKCAKFPVGTILYAWVIHESFYIVNEANISAIIVEQFG